MSFSSSLRSYYWRALRRFSILRVHSLTQYTYSSLDTFLKRDTYDNGVHKILAAPGVYLDVLLLDNPFDIPSSSRIPVFFSGAVTDREGTSPPYFSGRSFARKLGQGIIAISDPIFYCDDKITTGWYTGLPGWHTQSAITQILKKFSSMSERNVLCIGGSAGGFAALEAASSVDGAAAFVWNAQTSILDYGGYHIRPWMDLLFNKEWDKGGLWRQCAENLLEPTDIVHDVTSLRLPDNLLYLQNDTDWHVEKHLEPYVNAHDMREVGDGVYQGTSRQIIALAHFGDGHVQPPRELILRATREMTNKNIPTQEVYELLF